MSPASDRGEADGASPGRRHARGARVLMVAPQPFFRPRGTPFSVLHRIRALCAAGHPVDLVTYPFGEDVSIEGLRIFRAPPFPGLRDVPIGPSVRKLFQDVPLYFETLRVARRGSYDVLHSHEEAAFFCMRIARVHGMLHVYDMHSSLPEQLANFQTYDMSPIRRLFRALERRVIASCDGVITICQELADIAEPHCGTKPHAMIENTADDTQVFPRSGEDRRKTLALQDRRIFLYAGTFEAYQGLDLLLRAFARARKEDDALHLLMVGGRSNQVEDYRALCAELGIADAVTFTGSVAPSEIPSFTAAADVIVSPRCGGTNTPLKIYGYMRSGRPVLATDMPTHTQTLDDNTALLVPPTVEGLAQGMVELARNPQLGRKLARNAARRAETDYSDSAYMAKVARFYGKLLQGSVQQTVSVSAGAASE